MYQCKAIEVSGFKSKIRTQSNRWTVLHRGCFCNRKELRHLTSQRFASTFSLGPIDCIQRIALNQLLENLCEGLRFSKGIQPNGKPLEATTAANRMFRRCLEKAGLRRVRFHDLRHSFASILIQQGESLAYVKEQMGHHSIQMTVDLYAHLAPEGNKGAVDRLDDPDLEVGGRNNPQPIRKHEKKAPANQALIGDGAGNGI